MAAHCISRDSFFYQHIGCYSISFFKSMIAVTISFADAENSPFNIDMAPALSRDLIFFTTSFA